MSAQIALDGLRRDDEQDARAIIERAIEEHRPKAVLALVSGGKDSVVNAHVARGYATHIGMANTTIGSGATRQFVRELAHDWHMPFIEAFPPVSYEDIVLKEGFPGPGAHTIMFSRLKQRAFRRMRRMLGIRNAEVLFLSGVRKPESAIRRRAGRIKEVAMDDGSPWAAPLAHWETLSVWGYLSKHELSISPVANVMGLSGECECGAKARWLEIEDIRKADPALADYIEDLERRVTAAGIPPPYNRWGWGPYYPKHATHKEAEEQMEFSPAVVCGPGCGRPE